MKEWALAWCRAGFRVLPLHTIVEGKCTCDNGASCRSAGKHPLGSLAPHGTHSSTSDPDVVATWPDDGYNIGVVPSSTLVVVDFDDPDVVSALLGNEQVMKDVLGVRTRKGLHVYIQCEETRSGTIKYKGKHAADVQVDRIAVVPPSLHAGGGRYEFVGNNILEAIAKDEMIVADGDAYDYARYLLERVGIEADFHPSEVVKLPDGGLVQQADLPFEVPTDNENFVLLNQLLTGTYPVLSKEHGGRSGTLFMLGCEIYRAAARLRQTVTTQEVAAAVMKVDAVSYRKFTGRGDEHVRLLELAERARQETEADVQSLWGADTVTSEDGEDRPARTYDYDPVNGFVYRGGNQPIRLANFELKIKEERRVRKGDRIESREWAMVATRKDETYEFSLSPAQYGDPREFAKAVRKELPASFILEYRVRSFQGVYLAGIQHYSGDIPTRDIHAVTGWVHDRDAFILPGLDGAITADDLDTSVRFEIAAGGDLPQSMLERKIDTTYSDYSMLLWLIMRSGPPHIIIPILAQVIAAPLCSIGFDDREVLHVHGPTNSLKTSITEELMGIYGSGDADAMGIFSWQASTEGVIRKALTQYRDLPVLIDDYKAHGLIAEERVNSILQGAADRRSRQRLRRDSTREHVDAPVALPITTGEDVWERQRSTLSRTLVVNVSHGDLTRESTDPLRQVQRSGQLGALGVAWIRWLCAMGQENVRRYLATESRDRYDKMAEMIGSSTQRLVTSSTALYVTLRLFIQCVNRIAAPDIAEEFRQYAGRGWAQFMGSLREQVVQGESITPLKQMISAVSEVIRSGGAYLAPRLRKDAPLGMQGMQTIGWADNENVYFTRDLTYTWYQERCRRQGTSAGFSWTQICNEARAEHGAFLDKQRLTGLTFPTRFLAIPRHLIDHEDVLTAHHE